MKLGFTLREFYLYAASGIGLIFLITSSANLIALILTTTILPSNRDYYARPIIQEDCTVWMPEANQPRPCSVEELATRQEKEEENQETARTNYINDRLAQAIAFIIVGGVVFSYHWSLIKKESKGV